MSSQVDLEPPHSPRPRLGRRILIVGGVAGGASCAARLRRLDESVDIKVFDRGPYVAFANCGLPYYVGDVIADEGALLIASPEMFRERFNVEVHTNTDAISIDRAERTIAVRDLRTGNCRAECYDALVLSPGAATIRPPLPGVDLPGVFAVRNIPDSRRIRSWIVDRHASTAVVVGGGFIGLEMVENLIHRGLAVTVLEKLAAGHAAARSGDGGTCNEAPDGQGRAAPSRRWPRLASTRTPTAA
jgi:NADPH-dependent 2,4-dienoyl-CoA reductase/sulfur reductase-like enzyme